MHGSQNMPDGRMGCIPTSEEEWNNLQKKMRNCIASLMVSYHVARWATWNRQELVEEMTQQALLQAFAYARRAERGEVRAIDSFEALCITTIRHCVVDRVRKDKRLLVSIDDMLAGQLYDDTALSVEDLAIKRADRLAQLELLSSLLAKRIGRKQRIAFLTEIANNSDIDEREPCLWQIALRKYGIDLADYRHEIPDDPMLLSRHRADLWQARHKLSELAQLELEGRYAS